MFWRVPVEGTHRKIVVLALTNGELPLEIFKGIELVRSIKLLIVLAVTAFNLAVVLSRGGISEHA